MDVCTMNVIGILFVCVDALHSSQQFFSHVGTFFLSRTCSTKKRIKKILKNIIYRCPDKSVYWKIIFLISQPKHMLWVLKRTISIRRFF